MSGSARRSCSASATPATVVMRFTCPGTTRSRCIMLLTEAGKDLGLRPVRHARDDEPAGSTSPSARGCANSNRITHRSKPGWIDSSATTSRSTSSARQAALAEKRKGRRARKLCTFEVAATRCRCGCLGTDLARWRRGWLRDLGRLLASRAKKHRLRISAPGADRGRPSRSKSRSWVK